MNLAAAKTLDPHSTRAHGFVVRATTLGSMSRRSRTARVRCADHSESVAEVEAILRVFGPAWPYLATPIPGGDSGSGQPRRLDQRGLRIAERGPSGDDGGAYLYLLAHGRLGELRQYPIDLGGLEGWTGLLGPTSIRRALEIYPELCPTRLAKLLRDTLGKWLTTQALR